MGTTPTRYCLWQKGDKDVTKDVTICVGPLGHDETVFVPGLDAVMIILSIDGTMLLEVGPKPKGVYVDAPGRVPGQAISGG